MSKSKSPNLAVEAIVVAIKFFFIFLVLNNIVWGALYFRRSSVEITQSGNHDVVHTVNS